MTAQTYNNLHTRALQVMNETAGFANSEVRVGSLLRDMVDSDLDKNAYIDPLDYGAAGSGAVNDSAALLLAINAGVAAGKPVHGFGRLYGIAGNMSLVSDASLQDIAFKQLTPDATASVRTLTSNGANNIALVRVSVNRNGEGDDGSVGGAAGIWIEGGSGHYFEDVEVYGNDQGSGFVIQDSSKFEIVRLHVHDIKYVLGSDPGDDRVQGFIVQSCSDWTMSDSLAYDLGGNFGAGATTQWSRNAIGGCSNFTLVNPQAWNCDQALDLTGSTGNQNFRIIGGGSRDCYTTGLKCANTAKGGVVVGFTTERCDLYGFLVSGPAEAGYTVKCGDITFVNCTAFDTGSVGNYTTGIRPAGFAVEINAFDTTISPLGIRFIGCTAHDRQAVPTQRYGFANEVARPADGLRLNQCIDCTVIGLRSGGASYSGMHDAVDVSWQSNAQFPTKGHLPGLEWVEHFQNASSLRGFTVVLNGGGAGAAFSDEDAPTGRFGIGNCRTGTDVAGSAGLLTAATSIRLGGGRHRLRWDAQVATLSDGTNTFRARIGFMDSASAEPTDGVFFRYTHSVNSGNWEAVTRAAGVETVSNTGVPGSTSYASFEIEVNAAGTSAAFYINGTLTTNNTSNIPAGANLTGIGASIIKSAGASVRELRLDMMAYSFEPSTLL